MKKIVAIFVAVIALAVPVFAEGAKALNTPKEEIKVLILPKFESGEMSGDFPGEAQYYYEAYTMGGEEYEIEGGMDGSKLYVKDGGCFVCYRNGEGELGS